MADPTQIICSSECTVTVVHDLAIPLLTLTPVEGGKIAAAIVAVWVVGWAFRMAIKAMRSDEGEPES